MFSLGFVYHVSQIAFPKVFDLRLGSRLGEGALGAADIHEGNLVTGGRDRVWIMLGRDAVKLAAAETVHGKIYHCAVAAAAAIAAAVNGGISDILNEDCTSLFGSTKPPSSTQS